MTLKRWLHVIEFIVVTAILCLVFVPGIENVTFHEDEASRIASSDTFERFVRADFASDLWNESYWTLTQPPFSRYVIGVGRTVGGYDASQLNHPWSWTHDYEWNARKGNVPSPGLLWWSRLPMALLTVVSGLALFYLAYTVAGPVAGYAAVLLYVVNPYLATALRQALGESPLLAFLLLAALVALYAIPRWGRAVVAGVLSVKGWLSPVGWLALMGALVGLAGGAKLNGLAGAGAGVVLVVAVTLTARGAVSLHRRLLILVAGSLVVGLSAYLVFVTINPFLYPDPIQRTVKMFNHRIDEMEQQYTNYPPSRIDTLAARLKIVPQRVFEEDAALRYRDAAGWLNVSVINLTLTLLGLGFLLLQTWRWLRYRSATVAAAVVLAFGVFTAGPSLLTPLDWPRYYLFPVIFSTLCIAIAFGALAQVLVRLAQGLLHSARRSTSSV